MDRRSISLGLGAAGLAALAPRLSLADTAWPEDTVRIIVPFPAGGTADAVPRIVVNALQAMWKRAVIVDNRPGAAGNIGTAVVASAKPDGYTLLAAPPPPIAINQWLYQHLNYDPAQLRAISVMASAPNVVAVSNKLGVKTLAEFIAKAKAEPGALNVANQGIGTTSHLTAALFESTVGVQFHRIQYTGSAPALTDLAGGHVDAFFDNISSSLPQHMAGALRIIAVCSDKRVSQLPDVPTVAEMGYPGFAATAWYALMAPPGTPDEIVHKISRDVKTVLQRDDVRAPLLAQAAEPIGDSPEEAAAFIESERRLWGDVARKAGLVEGAAVPKP